MMCRRLDRAEQVQTAGNKNTTLTNTLGDRHKLSYEGLQRRFRARFSETPALY